MQLPTPPTDSLYKFLALSGLAILLIVPLYTQSHVWELQVDTAKLKAEIETINNSEQSLTEKERIEHAAKVATLEARLEQGENLLVSSYFAFGIGTLMTLLGFALWYQRVQKHLDAVLREQARQVQKT